MNDDVKWFMVIIAAFLLIPLVGIGVGEWRRQDCRLELAKIGKTVEEIKEICK